VTLTQSPGARSTVPAAMKGGTTIHDWHPEDDEFWERGGGKQVARRNLVWSILAEHIGFSVWLFWSMSAAMLAKLGFDFTVEQLFVLVAVPSAVGSFLRLPYTFAVPIFGGRNWTVISALLLVVPTLLFSFAVANPETPYWAFLLIAATAGFGGGNFASSMANINAFYPTKAKGLALGLNAAGGNIGVAVLQLGLPIVVGAGGLFGLIKASEGGTHLDRVGYLYAALSVGAAVLAYFLMNNLADQKSSVAETAAVVKNKHTKIMSFLYIGTFGSFIGYSGAFPLLIKINFSFTDAEGVLTGINFAYFAFLGAGIGSLTRPFGGWLADRIGGAKVTLAVFLLQALGTVGILLTLLALEPATSPEAAEANKSVFVWFLLAFMFVFAMTGLGNGSTYKMIPAIFKTEAVNGTAGGSPELFAALKKATVNSSAAVGIISAVGAFGGFLIPMMFGAPWIDNKFDAVINAFWIFTAFYLVCAAITFRVYMRKGTAMAEANV